jgi:quercetin dioxygenase-like cupin family protein
VQIPARTLLSEDALPLLPDGTANFRIERLTMPSGTSLPPETAPGPTVLLVEAGTLSVRVESGVVLGPGLDAAYPDTVLVSGERLVIAPDASYAVRNDGPTPAVALVVTIVPINSPAPIDGQAERP